MNQNQPLQSQQDNATHNSDNSLGSSTSMLSLPETFEKPKVGYCLADVNLEKLASKEYIAGMFPVGQLSLLIGESGAGKSWVLAAAALTITNNKEFLPTENYEVRNNGKVLLLETEGRIPTYAQRISSLGGNLQNFIIPNENLAMLSFSSFTDRELVEKIIREDKPDFVIVDSLIGFSDADENTSAVMSCVKWFNNLAVTHNVAVVFTQLVNKSETTDGKLLIKSVRGFSGIAQLAVVIWAIDVPDSSNNSKKRLYQVKNNALMLEKQDYIFRLENSEIEFTGEVFESTKDRTSKRREIFDLNKERPNKEIFELIKQVEPKSTRESIKAWIERRRRNQKPEE